MDLFIFLLILTKVDANNLIDGAIKFAEEYVQDWNEIIPETENLYSEYDFIIVGAGTAGCVLGNRLSENSNWKILLIEAGQDENRLMDIPMVAPMLQMTSINWDYESEPSNSYCLAMKGHKCKLPRGKVMGGSSVLNYMIYTRGNRQDYDKWASMGNPDWSYENVLPYFKKLENFTLFEDYKFHGTNGPLPITNPKTITPLAGAIVKANLEHGIPYVDYNGRTQTGVSYLQVTQKDGLRYSANKAYLHTIKNRPNLHILKGALVRKILINQNMKAMGVLVERDSRIFSIKQRKEVILSAGALNSPQVLMLSGIGPEADLSRLQIPLRKNLPVGQNLMDHIATGLTFIMNKPLSVKFIRALVSLPQYLNSHDGIDSLPGGCEVVTFYDLKDPSNPNGYPDIELLYISGIMTQAHILFDLFGVKEKYFKYYETVNDLEGFTIFPMLLKPLSRGYVTLNNNDPHSKPKIVPNYLQHPKDLKAMIEGIKLALNITQENALARDLGVRWHKLKLGADECPNLDNLDDYLECLIRKFTFTIYHQSGTCKMGPKTDPSTVVNQKLKVHGVKRLRVVDASIMPDIIAGHTNGPVFMIAEKGADYIKEYWEFKKGH